MGSKRDAVAAFLFVGAFVASFVTEQVCGVSSEYCIVEWPEMDDLHARYHCQPGQDGLGDPALSVGSLQFVAALAYLVLSHRFTTLPVVATFVGISSFLFHARNTVVHHRLDLTGVALVALAVFDAAVALDPVVGRRYAWQRLVLAIVPVVVLAVVHPTVPNWDPLWAITITYGSLAIVAYYYNRAEIDRIVVAGVVCLVAGIVLLFAADHQEWVCVSTQLTQFHYYGHLLTAAGVTLLSRTHAHQKYELFA